MQQSYYHYVLKTNSNISWNEIFGNFHTIKYIINNYKALVLLYIYELFGRMCRHVLADPWSSFSRVLCSLKLNNLSLLTFLVRKWLLLWLLCLMRCVYQFICLYRKKTTHLSFWIPKVFPATIDMPCLLVTFPLTNTQWPSKYHAEIGLKTNTPHRALQYHRKL